MKKSKQCPKCEGREIFWRASAPDKAWASLYYCCADCGYMEEYFQHPADAVANYQNEFPKERCGWVNPKPGEQGPYR